MFSSILEKPSKEILMTFNGTAYIFALCALAAGIAWIYYVAQAVDQDVIGGNDGKPLDSTGAAVSATSNVDTVAVMYQGTVVAILYYLVFRHHFHHV